MVMQAQAQDILIPDVMVSCGESIVCKSGFPGHVVGRGALNLASTSCNVGNSN